MKMLLILIVFIPLLTAQTTQITGPPTQFRKVTVAGLPSSPSTGTTVQVTNGASGADCSTGGGATKVWCTWTGSAWQAMSGSGGGSGTELTAAATPGADNTVMRSVGNSRAMEGTGCTITDTHQLVCTGGTASAGATAGTTELYEASANGTSFVAWKAPDALSASTTYIMPSTPPSGNQVLQCGTPSANVSTCSYVTAMSTARYTFQGVAQNGQSAWNMNYANLNNYTWGTIDGTHRRAKLVVTANTAGTALLSITPVVTTNPTVSFAVEASSTDGTNAGSMALAYACVAAGSSVDDPSTTGLTAISLTTISSTKEIFESSQAVTCTGTAAAPADLYVYWTPTAPSGGALSLLRLSLNY